VNGLPKILAQRSAEGRTELDIEVPKDNPWFEGHFPVFAILPGVVQIGWAVHYAGTLHGLGPAVSSIDQIKFRRPILPGACLTLHLKPDLQAGKLRYEYRDAQTSYSSGILNFGRGA
jgi:3-hydroxymyristoyl/3-hydroxydecanoyl-(acyl carrier protein) dehydratase